MTITKITGTKKAVGDYKRLNGGGYYSPHRGELMLDRDDGHVWTDEFYGNGGWMVDYRSRAIINLGRLIHDDGEDVTMATVKEYALAECEKWQQNND